MNHLNDISKVYMETVASGETQEEGYKPIDKKKENAMYRRAGNLARTSLSSKGKKKEEAQDKSSKIVSAISRQKENERFAKMGDEKARDNYKEEVEQVDENVATGKAKRAKMGGIAQRVGAGEAVSNQEKSDRFAKSVAAKKAALKAAGDAAHKAASDKGMSPAEAEMRRKAAERKAARAKKRQMGEALDPVGKEDGDVNNDGKKNKIDKYLMKRRKAIGKAIATREELELDENRRAARAAGGYKDDSKKQPDPSMAGFTGVGNMSIDQIRKMSASIENEGKKKVSKEEVEVPSGDIKKLAAKANKRIDSDVDGDVDHNDPKKGKYGEYVPSADGKKRLKTEAFSNWRQDLTEVITDDGEEAKPIKEKKVKNKIVINPDLKESVEQLGGELISVEEVELNEEQLIEDVVDSLYGEFLEEGYSEDDIEEAIESALQEAEVTFGHDTRKPKSEKKPEDRLGAIARLAKSKIKKYAKKAVVGGARALAKGATKLANKVERDNPNTFNAKKKDRSAATYRGQGVGRKERVGGAAPAPAAKRTKSTRSAAQRTQSAKTKTKRDKLDDLIAKVRSEQVVNEASYGYGSAKKPSPTDKRLTVTNADKAGNTPAYQAYKAGDKRYKAADHMKEGTTEAPMSPQELELQKRKTKIDLMISRKRKQALDKQNKGGQSEKMKESTEDSLRDRRMERGGVDGNVDYRRPPKFAKGPVKKKQGSGMSALDMVKADIRGKYGKGAIIDTKKKGE